MARIGVDTVWRAKEALGVAWNCAFAVRRLANTASFLRRRLHERGQRNCLALGGLTAFDDFGWFICFFRTSLLQLRYYDEEFDNKTSVAVCSAAYWRYITWNFD